jgi:hypothetical protein
MPKPINERVAWAVKYQARFKCQLCGDRDTDGLRVFRLEAHHNEYGRDRPEDLICLCSRCHAVHEYLQIFGRRLVEFLQGQMQRLRRNRVDVEMIQAFVDQEIRDRIVDEIDRLEYETALVIAMAEGRKAAAEWRDDEQRRAA